MVEWLQMPPERRAEILGLVSRLTGLPAYAVEKDWWVTLVLKAIFSNCYSQHLVFKGGTSLSKAWGLIERFSEDIDLVLDRSVLGFDGELSKTQIGKLRKASCAFISETFSDAVKGRLIDIGVPAEAFLLQAVTSQDSDRDPQTLQLNYHSELTRSPYLRDAVLIEIGARSLREPSMTTTITSVISQALGEKSMAGKSFEVLAVMPERTFLEKIFLLHEEFCKPIDKVRNDRMSRHLYDLERIMDTTFGINALSDRVLYQTIVDHRRNFSAMKGIDYDSHAPGSICFIPGEHAIGSWEKDYRSMQENMIYGQSLSFSKLILRLKELEHRIRILAQY